MIEASNRVLAAWKPAAPPQTPAMAPAETQAADNAPAETVPAHKDFKLFGEDGFTFRDLIDVINPLQHIPIISTIYRRLTGDELSPGARIAGATLFGGPIGAAVALVDTAIEYKTGHDIGGNALALLIGDEAPSGTAVAQAKPAAPDTTLTTAPLTTAAGGGAAAAPAFVAAATPDLGALSAFATGAGPAEALMTPIKLEPRTEIEPWLPPPAQTVRPIPLASANLATMTAAVPAPIAEPPAETPARPMPNQAAVAQAINALSQMPTSQTTAAVAELAATDSHAGPRRPMLPPAGDIPRGAAATLSRNAMRAYAASMARSDAQASSAAPTDSATAIAEVQRSTAAAQNDWIVDAMQSAMAKYEASARLRTQNGGTAPSIAVER